MVVDYLAPWVVNFCAEIGSDTFVSFHGRLDKSLHVRVIIRSEVIRSPAGRTSELGVELVVGHYACLGLHGGG